MGRCAPQDRQVWVDDLLSRRLHPGVTILTVAATVSSKGRYDGLQVGGAGATLVHHVDGSCQTFTNFWCLGTGVVQHDADCFSLCKAVEWLDVHFRDLRWHAPHHVYILMGSLAALTGIVDIRGHVNQRERLRFHSLLTALCDHYQGLRLTTVWSPPQRLRVTDDTARFKALVACHLTPRASLNRVQSATHSKAVTRECAFSLWARDWEEKCRATPGAPSWAYKNALIHPPDGSNHPLWTAAVATDKDPDMGRRVPRYTQHTTSTALCFAVGHAFTPDYTARFRPDIPLDQLACSCGWPTHSFDHLVLHCPRGHVARTTVSHASTYRDGNVRRVPWRFTSPHEFFTRRAEDFVAYIHLSCVGFKPPSDLTVPFDPG